MADGSSTESKIEDAKDQMSAEMENQKKDEPEEDVYEVEKIVGMCTNKGKTLYRVRWVGYSPTWDTWEPYENLTSCCEMIDKYVEEEKKEKESKQDLDTDVFSRESSENDAVNSPTIPKQSSGDSAKKREKKPSYYYVGSSDDEADTLKDKFWRNLEEGKVDVFSSDLYSRAKGSRSAKPQSFSEMFDNGRKFQSMPVVESKDDKPKATKKRRKKSRTSLDSQQGDGLDTDSVGSADSKQQAKTKTKAGSVAGKGKGKAKAGRRDSKDSETSSKSSVSSNFAPTGAESVGGDSSGQAAVGRNSSGRKKKKSESSEVAADIGKSNEEEQPIPADLMPAEWTDSVLMDQESTLKAEETEDDHTLVDEGETSLQDPSLPHPETDSNPASDKPGASFLDTISMLSKNYPLESDKLHEARLPPSISSDSRAPPEDWDQLSKRRKLESNAGSGGVGMEGGSNVPLGPGPGPGPGPGQTYTIQSDQFPKQSHPLSADPRLLQKQGPVTSALTVTSDPWSRSNPNNPPDYDPQRSSRWGAAIDAQQQTVVPAPVELPPISSPWTEDSSLRPPPVVSPDCTGMKSAKLVGDPRSETRGSSLQRLNNIDNGCLDVDLSEISQEWQSQSQKADRKLLLEPLELTSEELRQAVKDNAYQRASRAFKSSRPYDLELPDHQGNTLVMIAAQHGYDDMLEMLVLHSAKLNIENKSGTTPLMLAAEAGLRCTVELLVVMGAKMNSHGRDGETALVKAVKRGHKSVVRVLLDYGANFSSPSNGETPVKLAKLCNHRDIVDIINSHISKVTGEFENQVLLTLNNTASIICGLFPMQCFALRDGDKFRISFKHDLPTARSGVGVLLFIAHARITPHEVRCRFYGTCAVTAALLNGVQLQSLTEEGQFVLSFAPLQPGRNELEIYTVKAPTSRAKLIVCAYKAQLLGR